MGGFRREQGGVILISRASRRLFSFSLLLLAAVSFAGQDWEKFPVGPFSGLNDRDNSYTIPAQNAQALLNVEVTAGGKSVKKRRGYGIAWTLPITTSAVHGVYDFFDAGGNEVNLFFNDNDINSSVGGGSLNLLLSTGALNATYQCTDSLGQAYCANSSRTTLYKISGSTLTQIQTVSSTGTMVATAVTRLAMAGFSDAPSRIDFSAETDFTSWGSGSLGTSPAQFTINAPGSKITHITYAFGRLMWFKDTSFGYILIGNQPFQSDWVIKTVSYDVGTNDNTSVYREGILYFRGKDGHIYTFDGNTYERLSREITGTINQAQTRSSNSWTQTTQTDWAAGNITTSTWLNTTGFVGSVSLTTAAAIGSFIDSVSTSFAAGTETNVDTTSVPGYITIPISTNGFVVDQGTTTPANSGGNYSISGTANDYCSFYSDIGSVISTGTVTINNSATSISKKLNVSLYSNSSNLPGSVIVSTQISVSTVAVIGSTAAVFGSSSTPRFSFAGSSRLAPGTTYFLVIAWSDGSTDGIWLANNATTSSGTYTLGNPFRPGFSVYGKQFSSSAGRFTSRTFDTTFDTFTWTWQWGTFSSTGTMPSGSSVTYRTQYSNDSVNWSNTIVVATGVVANFPVSRYVRYLSTFTTTDLSTSPVISSITISSTERMRPWGTFDSQVNNAPNIASWDTFTADVVTSSGGTHTFYIRTSTGVFYTTATAVPAWVPVGNGGITTATVNAYFQIRDLIQTGSYAYNPLLNSFTINWFEGSASDKSYATYFDDKIFFSAPIGTGTTTNNKDLIYDLLNNTWIIWDLPSNGYYVKQNDLYFGSSSGGYVYKYGDIDNDAGSAINSYWQSKDFFAGDPFTVQEIPNISIAAKSVTNSTMTVTYELNGSSVSTFSIPLQSTNLFINNNRNLPAGTIGNTFSVQFGNNALDQYWEVFGVQFGVREKSWIPTP